MAGVHESKGFAGSPYPPTDGPCAVVESIVSVAFRLVDVDNHTAKLHLACWSSHTSMILKESIFNKKWTLFKV
jgi:hypothetical protein